MTSVGGAEKRGFIGTGETCADQASCHAPTRFVRAGNQRINLRLKRMRRLRGASEAQKAAARKLRKIST
jgi:hypothetical protein